MSRLSVIIITRNERANIVRCLKSVEFADEIVVVDQASTDGTVEIVKSFGARLTVTDDWPGFGVQKNRALDLATGDWILSIDADEELPLELTQQIRQVVAENPPNAFMLPRRTQFCGQWIRHCGWTPDHVLRLFPAGQARFTLDMVHERLDTNLAIRYLKAPLLHYSYPTPEHYWRKLSQYSQAWAQQRLDAGKTSSPGRALVSGLFAFIKSYVLRLGFLDGWTGLNVCLMQAQSAYGKHLTLYWLWINRQHVEKE